ncbi:MAG: acetoin utilization protein AcuC [Gammaproteobacteria bacterium]
MLPNPQVCLYIGEALGRYGFPAGHPFGPGRMQSFRDAAERAGLVAGAQVCAPVLAAREDIERFHSADYVQRVIDQSKTGAGYLDYGDTPAFPGVYEAAATVVGSTLDGLNRIMRGECRRAFVPIGGLHHARRDRAGGFCVFNDCGVAIEVLKTVYGEARIAYVDIDAHHGDGVYYEFEDDPQVYFADLHEDGRYLYPGTGAPEEMGTGAARGTKLNIPMPPGAGDAEFREQWPRVEAFLEAARPGVILLQCGADSVAGDPLTHLRYSAETHGYVARRLCEIAGRHAQGRVLAMGGGGYDHDNIAAAWTAVLRALHEAA